MSDTTKHLALLKQIPLFQSVPDEEMRRVARMAHSRNYLADERLVNEGEEGDEIYALIQGSVGIRLEMGDGSTETVAMLSPGDYFGEALLLGIGHRVATAVAKEGVEVFVWKNSDLFNYFAEMPAIGYIVMRNLARVQTQRLEHMNRNVRKIMQNRQEMKAVLTALK